MKFTQIRLFHISLFFLFALFIGFILNFFLNGTFWLWEYVVFIPEYLFLLFAILLFSFSVFRKDKKSAVVSLICILLTISNLPVIPAFKSHLVSPHTITVFSHNKGFWQPFDKEFANFLKSQDSDIIFIQESLETESISSIQALFPGWYVTRGHDVVTISRFPIIESKNGKTGRFLRTTINAYGKEVELYNAHIHLVLFGFGAGGPVRIFETRKKGYEELYTYLEANDKCKIIGGDFNTKSNSKELSYLLYNYRDSAVAYGGYPITWASFFPLFRVDYLFSSKVLTAISYDAFTRLPSDHYVLKSEFSGVDQCP